MSKLYYQIEDGEVISSQYGSDIPGDPTATKQAIESWVLESPGTRSISEIDPEVENPPSGEPKYLKLIDGKVVFKNQAEKDQVDSDEESDKLNKKNARQSKLDSIQTKGSFTDDEMKELASDFV